MLIFIIQDKVFAYSFTNIHFDSRALYRKRKTAGTRKRVPSGLIIFICNNLPELPVRENRLQNRYSDVRQD